MEDLFNAGLNLRFQYGGDEPYAVLVAAALTNHTDQGVVSRMSLRYSGDPLGTPNADEHDAFECMTLFLDQAHEAIVETFAGATSPDLHAKYGGGTRA